MMPSERKQIIADLTRERQFVSVDELCEILAVSPATIRRDLTQLDNVGLISRTHGGAAFIENDMIDFPLDIRERDNTNEKKIIAEKALSLIHDGETIFMDSSSTCGFLAKQFGIFKDLRVITNGINIAGILMKFPAVETHCTGGRLLPDKQSLVGVDALDFLKRHNAQTCFFSCKGFDAKFGITDSDDEQAAIKSIMIANSEKHILLCDSSKFYRSYFCKICDTDFPYIISDREIPKNDTE